MPALLENQRFERYRVIRHVGSGVSGESYEAEDTMLQRKVTLKLIHPWNLLPDAARRQFFREMQGISLLNHSNLATILDYGELDGRLYVVRRYVTSGSLLSNDGRLWFQPPLNVHDAIHYGHQLAQALQHVHNRGCLHGGLSFSNILVLRGANIDAEPDFAPFLLADVGLANFVRRFGQPQMRLLPITAAPEQLGKRVTPASDQFALAVILYFWLAGRPPYLGQPEEIEHLKLSETITSLSALNTTVTFDLEVIVRRALAVYPEDRYPSIQAFADALMATLVPQITETPLPDLTVQPAAEFERLPQTDPVLNLEQEQVPEPEEFPVAEFISQAGPLSPAIFRSNPTPDLEPKANVEFQANSHTGSPLAGETDSDQQPQPAPERLPQPTPEPLPQPAPEPLPQPTPVPLPQTEPESPAQPEPTPLPQPDPDPLPQPAPDVFQPLTEPGIEPPPLPQTEPSTESDLSIQTESLETQNSQPITRARLIISLHGAGEPYEYIIEREETTLGRAGSDDVQLNQDTLTSRHHALLKHQVDRYVLYDLHSASGVFVEGQKLVGNTGFVLVDGDHISIGNYELIFHSPVPWASNQPDEISPAIDTPDTKVDISS